MAGRIRERCFWRPFRRSIIIRILRFGGLPTDGWRIFSTPWMRSRPVTASSAMAGNLRSVEGQCHPGCCNAGAVLMQDLMVVSCQVKSSVEFFTMQIYEYLIIQIRR